MPEWYLAPWTWDATTNPDAPRWRPPAGAVAAVDLRSDAAQSVAGPTASGVGFFGFPTTQTLTGATYYGNDLAASMSAARRTNWRNALSIATALDSTRLIDILAETLGAKSDPGATVRAKPLLPTQGGDIEIHLDTANAYKRPFDGTADVAWSRIQNVEQDDYRSVRARCLLFANALDNAISGDGSLADRVITAFAAATASSYEAARQVLAQRQREKYLRYLGGLVLKYRRWSLARSAFIPADLTDEGELPPETTITDDFNRADGALGNSAEGWAWTNVQLTLVIASNVVASGSTSTAQRSSRAESDLSSSDHYAQATDSGTGTNRWTGLAIRFASAATTYYCLTHDKDGTDFISKCVTGTLTTLQSPVVSNAAGATIKLRASGSTLTYTYNGADQTPLTDSSITGNTRTGMVGDSWTSSIDRRLDNFSAGDLAAATKAPPIFQRRARLWSFPGKF